jgi:hypothetical protein
MIQKIASGMTPGHHLVLHLKSPCIRCPAAPETERKQTLAGLSNPKYRHPRKAAIIRSRLTVSSVVVR